ncbi:MAG TPA: cytochrome c3 family protein [Candidatus Binatia bacterium]|jgi:predicted CXXCH cytochrome family protein|nr:cytochrome c3 family protein [Candidatus Binatia bacterium]
MARTLVAALLVAVLAPSGHADDSCVQCHGMLPAPLGTPVEGMRTDVHAKAGLSCADCHGGDPGDTSDGAMSKAKGFVGKPSAADVPAFCGRCHADENVMRRWNPHLPTDQLAQYRTSVHGKRLAEGDDRVATCVSCHGVHGILPVGDARSPVHKTNVATTCARCHADAEHMKGYDIPTDQLAKWEKSVHGELLLVQREMAAPTCNDCHGNHGAFPPGADSVAAVCGQCHVSNKDFFLASPHRPAFERLGLPECVTCHQNHLVSRTSDAMLGNTPPAVCTGCHAPDSKGFAAAGRMRAAVDGLRTANEHAEASLATAAAAGMEVSEAEFAFRAAREALVAARTRVHTFDPAAVEKVAADGVRVARAADEAGAAALVQRARRRWMALIPLAAIGLVGVLVYGKIRALGGAGGPPAP